MERPDYASKKRIEKKLLYPDGTQRASYLSLVDEKGCFVYMIDTGEAEHLKYHDSAALIAIYESDMREAWREFKSLQELYKAQESYIEELTKLILWAVDIIDAAIIPRHTPDRLEKAGLTQRKTRFKEAVARKVVLDDEKEERD